jgi:hypothetical protein
MRSTVLDKSMCGVTRSGVHGKGNCGRAGQGAEFFFLGETQQVCIRCRGNVAVFVLMLKPGVM